MMRLEKHWLEWLTTPYMAARGQRAEGYAMVALTPSDNVTSLEFTGFKKILSGELKTNFDRLRSTRDVENSIEPGRRAGDQMLRKLLCHLRRKESSMGE